MTTRRSSARADEAADTLRRLGMSTWDRVVDRIITGVGDEVLSRDELGARVEAAVTDELNPVFPDYKAKYLADDEDEDLLRVEVRGSDGTKVTIKIGVERVDAAASEGA